MLEKKMERNNRILRDEPQLVKCTALLNKRSNYNKLISNSIITYNLYAIAHVRAKS